MSQSTAEGEVMSEITDVKCPNPDCSLSVTIAHPTDEGNPDLLVLHDCLICGESFMTDSKGEVQTSDSGFIANKDA